MPQLILLLFIIALLVAGAYVFVNADPQKLAGQLRIVAGSVLLLVAVGLAVVGRWGFALPMAFFAISLLTRGRFFGISGTSRKSAGQQSRVRARYFDMRLDHDSGEMNGEISAGRFAGARLSALDLDDLRTLLGEVADDADSLTLLETYLERRYPGWRDKDGDERAKRAQTGRTGAAGPMSLEEAREVLGVPAGASIAQIRAAHRKLMKNVHPDQGGSTYLAAKLNEARDLLIKQAGRS